MIAVSIDAAGMKIVRPLLVKAKEVEESELSGFGKKEIHALKETLRDLVRHCTDKEVLDNGSEDSEPLARNDSNYQSATRERS